MNKKFYNDKQDLPAKPWQAGSQINEDSFGPSDGGAKISSRNFYITTTLPYVNDKPHMGHALEFVQADILARYHQLIGDEVVFNVGTDEHGLKIYRKAQEQGKDIQAYVDEYAAKFQALKSTLNLSYTNFIRTTDPHHKAGAQEFWRRCLKNGDIYKSKYQVKYCVGCELEKTESELENGKCPIHPNLTIENVDEENYFFRWSKYQKPLLDLYAAQPDFVVPDFRFNEIKKFVEGGLQDFSISRLKSKMPWGVAVPDDENQVMYVWFDALTNYITTLGWPENQGNFNAFWPGVQIAGKDNLRQQSAMWQAMLLSAGLKPSKQIIIHGFITSGGQKMSKSLGNTVDPLDVVAKYGTEAFRYWVAKEANTFEDSDFTLEKFKDSYNGGLANGLGNLVSRIMKMATTNLSEAVVVPPDTIPDSFKAALDTFNIKKAADIVWEEIASIDSYIQKTEPFKLLKTDKPRAIEIIKELVTRLYAVGRMLNPILPETSETIKNLVKQNKMPDKPLFLRVD